MKKILMFIIFLYACLFIYVLYFITSFNEPHYKLHSGSSNHIVAHRGYSSLARENSKESIKIANNSDCVDLIELDVRLTKDKVLVLSHDNRILKIGKNKYNISNLTYEQLKKFRFLSDKRLPLERQTLDRQFISMPTLEEIMKSVNKKIVIDIKYNKNIKVLNSALLFLLNQYDNVIIQSSNLEGLNDLYNKNPNLKYQFIIDSFEDYYNVPEYVYGVSIKHTLLKIEEIKNFFNNNIKVFIWTINDIESYKNVLDTLKSYSSKAYFVTDYPEILCTYDIKKFMEV